MKYLPARLCTDVSIACAVHSERKVVGFEALAHDIDGARHPSRAARYVQHDNIFGLLLVFGCVWVPSTCVFDLKGSRKWEKNYEHCCEH